MKRMRTVYEKYGKRKGKLIGYEKNNTNVAWILLADGSVVLSNRKNLSFSKKEVDELQTASSVSEDTVKTNGNLSENKED